MPLGYLGGFQRPLFHHPSESLHNTVQPQHLPQAKEGGCCLLPLGSTPSSPSLCQHGDGQEGASLPRSHQGRTPPPAAETLKPQPQGEAAPQEAGGAPARPQVTPATSASPGTRGRGGKARMLDPSRLRSHAGHSTSLLLSARARTAGFSSSRGHARASRPGHV